MEVFVQEISTANFAAETNVRKERNISLEAVFTDASEVCSKKQPLCPRTKSSK